MISFAKKIVIFLLPLSLLFAFPASIYYFTREYYSASAAIASQKNDRNALVGFAFRNAGEYKKNLIAEEKPEIFVLGTSRSGQFRREFFSRTFSSAGNSAYSFKQMREFIDELPQDYAPKMILLGIDREFFFPESIQNEQDTETPPLLKDFFLGRWRDVYLDYFSGKFDVRNILNEYRNTPHVGLNAMANHAGYRADGSWKYGDDLLYSPKRREKLRNDIDGIVRPLQGNRETSIYREPISDEMIGDMNPLLDACVQRNIRIVGFFPPYPEAYRKELLSKNDAVSERMERIGEIIETAFKNRGYSFFDFADIKNFGGLPDEFVDSAHGTDKINLRMAIYMAERDEEFAKFVDMEKAKGLLERTTGDFLPM